MRRAAANSNAAIAKEVADKRSQIAAGKLQAQETVKQLQQALSAVKAELKARLLETKRRPRSKGAALGTSAASIDLLHKLKEARDAGLLTAEEFEAKRQKLVSEL